MTTATVTRSRARQQRALAAAKLGITLDDYNRRLEAGEKWCAGCRAWHARSAFGKAAGRADGLQGICREAKRTPRDRHQSIHAGHHVTIRSNGWPYCRTCRRSAQDVDEMAVERAVSGDPPAELTLAEQAAAIVQLRRYGLTYRVIAERVGCSVWVAWSVCHEHGLTTRRSAPVSLGQQETREATDA